MISSWSEMTYRKGRRGFNLDDLFDRLFHFNYLIFYSIKKRNQSLSLLIPFWLNLNSNLNIAEGKRFELLIPFWSIHTFQACSIDHSDSLPFGLRCKDRFFLNDLQNYFLNNHDLSISGFKRRFLHLTKQRNHILPFQTFHKTCLYMN